MPDAVQIPNPLVRDSFRTRLGVWNEKRIRGIAFVVRCSGAATAAYLVASWAGLPHSVWAAMSAIIVSQEHFEDTSASLTARIIGTLIGIGVAVGVNLATTPLGLDPTAQIAAGVAICALVARSHPTLRVCMWTCPIVFLTAEPTASTAMVGLYRGSEVILGALIGAVLHCLAEAIIEALARRLAAEPKTGADALSLSVQGRRHFSNLEPPDVPSVLELGIDQSMSIVAETEQIADPRNSPLKSRARFFDGSR